MTGAVAVAWFLKRKKTPKPKTSGGVKIVKSEGLREAQRAVQESAARKEQVSRQQGAVSRVAHSLAEIRQNNHFADRIRTAMGGEQ